MARIKIDIPETFPFQTEIPVRITDLNYGGHVGNDVFLSLIHEIRLQFLKNYGFSEMNIDGVGTIMNEALITYKTEVFYGSVIVAKVAIAELSSRAFTLVYHLSDKATGKEVVRAKTSLVFFNYDKKKITHMPEIFRKTFE